ncbi:MAG: hypothetical protein DLM64_00790, partial [Solirubrobacterales bacterium]
MAQRLAEPHPQLLRRDGRERAAPLQPIGAVSRLLDHPFELLRIELDHVRMGPCGLVEGRAQTGEEHLPPALRD